MGATLFTPPQLTGRPEQDVPALGEYIQQMYRILQLEPTGYSPNGWVSGSFTIEGTETGADVTFAAPQSDAQYTLGFAVLTSSVGSDVNSLLIAGYEPAAEGFTVALAAAPGSGQSVSFTYHVRR